jgi:hypothetical protein
MTQNREGPVGERRQDPAAHDLLVADDFADVALTEDGVPDHRKSRRRVVVALCHEQLTSRRPSIMALI